MLRVWCGQAPWFEPIRPQGNGWVLGRETVDGDSRMSRRHCEVKLSGGRWTFTDLGSANGSYVDARAIGGTLTCTAWRVLLVGRSLFVPLAVDARAPLRMRHTDEDIIGPSLHGALEQAKLAAAQGRVIVFAGPVGCGVEPLVFELHRVLGEVGKCMVVDVHDDPAASLPATGTLLVLGYAEIEQFLGAPVVRAALASPGLRVCLAVTRAPDEACELPPALAQAGVVRIPRFEARPEEVPWWVRQAVRTHPELAGLEIDVTLPEACLLRPWAHGVPDLIGAVHEAMEAAQRAGRPRVMGRHLSEWAGSPGSDAVPPPRGRREPPSHLRERDLVAAMLVTHGDREGAARALGISVEALEQWVRRHRITEAEEAGVSEASDSIDSFEVVEEDPEETA
jgi:hypothetical protein